MIRDPLKVGGLDISTRTGAVILQEGGKKKPPKVLGAKEIVAQEGLKGLARARMLARLTTAFVCTYNPDLVVIEDYGFASNQLATQVEISTLIRESLWKHSVTFCLVAPTQLKKFILGKGSGKKDLHRLEVFKRWGFEHTSDNVVDAYGLACIALALRGRLAGLTKPQREVLEKLAKEGRA